MLKYSDILDWYPNDVVQLNHSLTSINGGFPVAISITVQPNDQMSA